MLTNWTNTNDKSNEYQRIEIYIEDKDKLVVLEKLFIQVKIRKELLLHLIKVNNLRKQTQETEG